MTTGVAGCNRLVIADFLSTFATAVEAAGVVPGRVAVVAFVRGVVAEGVVFLAVSAVACVACPSAIPDTGAAGGVWDAVAGAVIVAMAGRLVNVRCCGAAIGAGDIDTEGLCGSLGLAM